MTITEHWESFNRVEFGAKKNFKKIPNFEIPFVIITWNRMLQEYFKTDPESTFFNFGDNCEQKKKNNNAPYDNIVLSTNDGVETKVMSFAYF